MLIDNNDSFTNNLMHLIISAAHADVTLINYAELCHAELQNFDGFVISPGPGEPAWYPDYTVIFDLGKPVFGVCLGMQILCSTYGGKISRLGRCIHGVGKDVTYKNKTITAAVYNSLHCAEIPRCFSVFAFSDDQAMGIIHDKLPFAGVQFHPESFMTPDGEWIIKDVFKDIGLI